MGRTYKRDSSGRFAGGGGGSKGGKNGGGSKSKRSSSVKRVKTSHAAARAAVKKANGTKVVARQKRETAFAKKHKRLAAAGQFAVKHPRLVGVAAAVVQASATVGVSSAIRHGNSAQMRRINKQGTRLVNNMHASRSGLMSGASTLRKARRTMRGVYKL